jgi:hypothetical protein
MFSGFAAFRTMEILRFSLAADFLTESHRVPLVIYLYMWLS